MTNPNHQATPNELPTFEGWTVDLRLEEFRRMVPDEECQFVSFDSETGEDLLARYAASQDGKPNP